MKLGSTGKFPQGKIKKDDQGELRMAIFGKDGKIIIDFGKELSWIGFSKDEARQLGNLLIKKSNE